MRPTVSSDSSSARLRASDPTATWNRRRLHVLLEWFVARRRPEVRLHALTAQCHVGVAGAARGEQRLGEHPGLEQLGVGRTGEVVEERRRAAEVGGVDGAHHGPPAGPRRIVIKPCTSSSRRPSRSDSRLTLYCSSIAASGGRPSPGCSPAATMSWTTSRAIASEVFSGRVIAPPEWYAIGRWAPPLDSDVAAAPRAGGHGHGHGAAGGSAADPGGAPLGQHDATAVLLADLVEPDLHRHAGHEVLVSVERADGADTAARRGRRARPCRAWGRPGAPDASRRSTSAAWRRPRRPPSDRPSCRTGGSKPRHVQHGVAAVAPPEGELAASGRLEEAAGVEVVDAPYHFEPDGLRVDEIPVGAVRRARRGGRRDRARRARARSTWEHVAPVADQLAPGVDRAAAHRMEPRTTAPRRTSSTPSSAPRRASGCSTSACAPSASTRSTSTRRRTTSIPASASRATT